MKVTIEGKVLRVEQDKNDFYYEVACAATDAYTKPNVFRVKSKTKLCAEGDIRIFECQVTSWVGRDRYTDKKTGELKESVRPVVLLLADAAQMPKAAVPRAVSN